MRIRMPILLILAMAGFSGAANAMSTIGIGEKGDPYPTIFILAVAVVVFVSIFIAVEGLERFFIGRMKRDADVERLIRALGSKWLASKAAYALGDIKDDTAVGPLLDALHNNDGDVRRAAAKALGEIGDGRAIEPLMLALDDEYLGVRECVSYALKKLSRPGKAP